MNPKEIRLFDKLVKAAEGISDGHLTVMRFTTNWRVTLSTIDGRTDIQKMWVGSTFEEAVEGLLDDLSDFIDASATKEEEAAYVAGKDLPVFRRGRK